MKPVTYIIRNGDLIQAAMSFNLIDIFAHGANCWSTMGAGIARIVAMEFPAVALADVEDERSPDARLGGFSHAFDHSKGVHGANLYTQFYPGPNARMPSVISSVQLLFERVHEIVEATDEETVYVGFPAIGCGIGGLNFQNVVCQISKIAITIQEDSRRRVVPVFYIREKDGFDNELNSLSELAYEYGILIVDSEEDVLDEEA